MKCTWSKRFGRVISNFGITFLTPLIGINVGNSVLGNSDTLLTTIFQSVFCASIFTGMSVLRELGDWSNVSK